MREIILSTYKMYFRNVFPDMTNEYENIMLSIVNEAIDRVERSHGNNYQIEDVEKMFNHILKITDPDNKESYLNQYN